MDDTQALLQEWMPIDTHFHYFHCLDQGQNAQEALDFAFAHGMRAVIEAGTPSYTFAERKKLAQQYPHMYLLAGHHPDELKNCEFTNFDTLQQALAFEKTLAVGEIGLDYSLPVDKARQQQLFAAQMAIAKQAKKPVVLHIREAHEDALAMIAEQNITEGIVHCFTGNKAIAQRWLDRGFFLSFSGIVTFKNATDVQDSALYTPLDRLFCETDAPFLAPVPHRGTINQTAFVAYVYQYISTKRFLAPHMFSTQLAQNFDTFIKLALHE